MKNNKNGVSTGRIYNHEEWNKEYLQTMCDEYGFTYEFFGDTMFVRTGISKWRFDTSPGSFNIKLYHYNMFSFRPTRRKFGDEYHLHDKRYPSPAEVIRYIYAHDKNGYSYMRQSKEDKYRSYAKQRLSAVSA